MSSGQDILFQILYSATLSLRSFRAGRWLAVAGWEAQALGTGFLTACVSPLSSTPAVISQAPFVGRLPSFWGARASI